MLCELYRFRDYWSWKLSKLAKLAVKTRENTPVSSQSFHVASFRILTEKVPDRLNGDCCLSANNISRIL
ncbi:hypothetical protein RRG08_056942 [Elysia crispata]|uniref:Uncharacterized protein n=1 Tax=Elysia crispata TaxID=231223 RepID=A0AAE0Z5Y1_9GAST|nr:hypothetical protein RRG08_056942 [Elysia crispata]